MGAYISFFGFIGAFPIAATLKSLYIINNNAIKIDFPHFVLYKKYKIILMCLIAFVNIGLHVYMVNHPTGNAFSSQGSKKDQITNQLGMICFFLNILLINMVLDTI